MRILMLHGKSNQLVIWKQEFDHRFVGSLQSGNLFRAKLHSPICIRNTKWTVETVRAIWRVDMVQDRDR